MSAGRRPFRGTPLLWLTALVHGGGLAALAVRPAWWPLMLPAFFANHVVLALLGVAPRSRALGPNLRRLPPSFPGVALTFDDGPDPEVTPRVLELLAAGEHRATFFCVGERAQRHPELIGELVATGHRVENHTHRHSSWFSFYPPGALRREIVAAQRVLGELAGRAPRYLRVPAGARSPWLEPVIARLGLHLVSWTRRGFDTATRDPDRIHRRLVAGLGAGDILMLHDRRLADRRPPVLEVLPRLLGDLDRRGLRSLPLPEPEPDPEEKASD
jgi:peptidoglycan/xylan/chitin deacetylase (PgdA/CDA1 family)